MTELHKLVPALILHHLTSAEKEYLKAVFDRFGGFPDLEQVWSLMDEPWVELNCDPLNMDERVTAYYQHPVWLLNGLFVERHELSLENRRRFTQWIVDQAPQRVADFGGGFGALARFIGEALPKSKVEVVDTHSHPAAMALAADTPNVRYVQELSGEYDMLIATDVFEHVPDPIGLTAETAEHLRVNGQYLIASCFSPVIRCHLPQLFHFSVSWDAVMQAMSLQPEEKVVYGRSYRRRGEINVTAAREKGECSRKIFPLISRLPSGKARASQILMQAFCR